MTKPVTLTFLGGLGEIGRNCAVFEYDNQLLLIDCGLMFPDSDMLGVDVVLPDFTYLREHPGTIVGCVLTHGHEDHVGALSYLLKEFSFPLYGAELTLGLARGRIEENGLMKQTSLHPAGDGELIQVGPFGVQFIPMTHSVPFGMGIALHTPQGLIFHTGDFKIDLTPVDGRRSDLATIGSLARGEGVRLLLSDSTNADDHGHTTSETQVGRVLYDLMHDYNGKRIVTACFASHLHRVQQIGDAAIEFGRYIFPLGRSMRRNIAMGIEMGVLNLPADRVKPIEQVNDYDPGQVCVISTGSQGEPMSALALMGAQENRWLKIGPADVVILSSHPIPGNEHSVSKVIDGLTRLGAEVIHSGIADVHSSGHAKQEELKLMMSLAQPEWFIPVHGEYTHMTHHARLGRDMGLDAERILVCEDGDQLQLTDDGVVRIGTVPSEYVFVDGTSVGEVGNSVLHERRVLAEEGVVTATVCIDFRARKAVGDPQIVTRGWINEAESGDLLSEARSIVAEAVDSALDRGVTERDAIAKVVRKAIGSYVAKTTRRRPMIVPIVVNGSDTRKS